jgi:sigma54-dependent transcription regulator
VKKSVDSPRGWPKKLRSSVMGAMRGGGSSCVSVAACGWSKTRDLAAGQWAEIECAGRRATAAMSAVRGRKNSGAWCRRGLLRSHVTVVGAA